MSLVRRHPTIAFFVLVYTLAWGFGSPLVFLRDNVTDTRGFVLVLLASNVPSVVGIVLTAILLGRGALRKLLGWLLIWRVNPFWYLAVILGPVALAGGAAAFDTLLGGPTLRLGMPLGNAHTGRRVSSNPSPSSFAGGFVIRSSIAGAIKGETS